MKYFLMVFLLFAGCSSTTSGPNAKGDVSNLSIIKQDVDDEIVIGRHMAAKLLGHFGSYEGREALEYVNLVGQSLAQRFGRPELKFYFGILNAADANAFATPGGYIFITRGLLKSVKTESELAGVLAHEIAHVNEKHMYNEIAERRQVTTEETISRVISRGSGDLARTITRSVDKGMQLLLEKGIAPSLEKEADGAAIQYLAAAGYRLREFAGLLNRLSLEKTASSVVALPGRITALEESLHSEGLANAGSANWSVLEKRFKRSLASVK